MVLERSPDGSLPVVDLDDPKHITTLKHAVGPAGPGFFYLKFPGLAAERAADETLQLSREFFCLPSIEKKQLQNDTGSCYWVQEPGQARIHLPSTGPGYRAVGHDENFAGDARESFNIRMPGDGDLCTERCGLGRNKWPDAKSCSAPATWCSNFREKCEEYFRLCFETSASLRASLEDPECLGPFLGTGAEKAFTRSTSLLGFTHYDYVDFKAAGYAASGAQMFGIRPHQDDGLFTLLYTDGQPGLQYAKGARQDKGRNAPAGDLSLFSGELCRTDDQFSEQVIWEAVPFRPGHWIVNLGTDLFRWAGQGAKEGTCRPCKATLHRVVRLGTQTERYSMPFFYEANLDACDPCFPFKNRYEYLVQEAQAT